MSWHVNNNSRIETFVEWRSNVVWGLVGMYIQMIILWGWHKEYIVGEYDLLKGQAFVTQQSWRYYPTQVVIWQKSVIAWKAKDLSTSAIIRLSYQLDFCESKNVQK